MKPLFPREKLVGESGHLLTQGLFHEFKMQHKLEWTPYTLKDYDHENGSLSMHNIYIQAATEYEAAITLLGNWAHWKKLCECSWFKPYKQAWDHERRLLEETMAKRILMKEAEYGNVPAAKALYEGPKALKGRPSNDEKHKEVKKQIEIEEMLTKAHGNVISLK